MYILDITAEKRFQDIMKKHIEELKEQIEKYCVLSERDPEQYDYSKIPNRANVIVFGPTGSGKSSLVRTFIYALNGTFLVSEDIMSNLVIQNVYKNEGTSKFTCFRLKEPTSTKIDAGDKIVYIQTSEITVMDTRGQILMDEHEIKQLNILIDGKVQDMSVVEQRNRRYAYLLWEFWKKDSELFPNEILTVQSLENQPHSIIFVFDGSLDDIPNGEEETKFYQDILSYAREKNKVEEKLDKMVEKKKISPYEKETKLREEIDQKIEKVVLKLGVPRNCVHFIENYHDKHTSNGVSIDYYALKLLFESLKQSDSYLKTKAIKKGTCSIMQTSQIIKYCLLKN